MPEKWTTCENAVFFEHAKDDQDEALFPDDERACGTHRHTTPRAPERGSGILTVRRESCVARVELFLCVSVHLPVPSIPEFEFEPTQGLCWSEARKLPGFKCADICCDFRCEDEMDAKTRKQLTQILLTRAKEARKHGTVAVEPDSAFPSLWSLVRVTCSGYFLSRAVVSFAVWVVSRTSDSVLSLSLNFVFCPFRFLCGTKSKVTFPH